MKKLVTLSLIAASAFALAPKPAVAGDKGLAVLGGFLGGLIVANSINNQSDYCAPSYGSTYYPAPPIAVVSNGYGYWDYTPFQVWVAPRWVVTYDAYRHPHRHYVSGHYRTETSRVWINGHHRVGLILSHNSVPGYRHDRRHDRRDDQHHSKSERRADRRSDRRHSDRH